MSNMQERILSILQQQNVVSKFFIEAGANDGLEQSNTTMLEFQYGWKGLCIEPNIINYNKCIKNRPQCIVVNAALVSHTYASSTVKGTFNDLSISRANGLMSSCEQAYIDTFPEFTCEVPARTLTSILDENGSPEIGFMSLDVENYELEALSGLDFERYRPNVILMEIGKWNQDGVTEKHMEFMVKKDYSFLQNLNVNDFVFIDQKV